MQNNLKSSAKKVKPVKAWVVVDEDSVIGIETAFIRDSKEEAWEDIASNSFMSVSEYKKESGGKAIRVLITPL